MKKLGAACAVAIFFTSASIIAPGQSISAKHEVPSPLSIAAKASRSAAQGPSTPGSAQYQQVQKRLTAGWNTWDVHSVTTQVLLPDGLAIHVGLKHNTTLWSGCIL